MLSTKRIEYNTEAKLESIINQSSSEFEIKRSDLDRVAIFFGDKLDRLEEDNVNENDRRKLFGDLRSLFLAFNKKLKEFYVMQDHLSNIIGGSNKPT